MTPEYQKALEVVREATRVYDTAQQDFRAGMVDDAAFLVAQAIYRKAEWEFDRAFEKEETR